MSAAGSAARHDGVVTSSVVSILERPEYGTTEAADLLGLRPDRTRAWLDGYEQRGVRYPPDRPRERDERAQRPVSA